MQFGNNFITMGRSRRPGLATLNTGVRFDWYVDAVLGLDANSGSQASEPKQTLAGWLALGAALDDTSTLLIGEFDHEALSADFTRDKVKVRGRSASDRAVITGWLDLPDTWTAFSAASSTEGLVNGGFETWTGTYPANWSGSVTAPVTLTKDTSAGENAVFVQANTGGTGFSLSQTLARTYKAGEEFDLVVDHIETGGATVSMRLSTLSSTTGKTGWFLKPDGGFQNTTTGVTPATKASRTTDTFHGIIPADFGDVTFSLQITRGTYGSGNNGTIKIYSVSVQQAAVVAAANTWRFSTALTNPIVLEVEGVIARVGTDPFTLGVGDFILSGGWGYLRTNGTNPNSSAINVSDLTQGFKQYSNDGYGSRTGFEWKNLHYEGFKVRAIAMRQGAGFRVENVSVRGIGDDAGQGAIRADQCTGLNFRNIHAYDLKTEGVYWFDVKDSYLGYIEVTNAEGASADSAQWDYFTNGTNSNGANANNVLEQFRFDQTEATRSPKGCFINVGGDGCTLSYGDCAGGYFSLGGIGNNHLQHHIRGHHAVGNALDLNVPVSFTNWESHHCIWDHSFYGINGALSPGVFGYPVDINSELTNFRWANENCVYHSLGGVIFTRKVSGSFTDCLFYNPDATGADVQVDAVSVGQTLSFDHCAFGPARTGQFKFLGVSYNSLADVITAAPAGFVFTSCVQLAGPPEFVDGPNGDYRLQSGSTLLTSGTSGGPIGAETTATSTVGPYLLGAITDRLPLVA